MYYSFPTDSIFSMAGATNISAKFAPPFLAVLLLRDKSRRIFDLLCGGFQSFGLPLAVVKVEETYFEQACSLLTPRSPLANSLSNENEMPVRNRCDVIKLVGFIILKTTYEIGLSRPMIRRINGE